MRYRPAYFFLCVIGDAVLGMSEGTAGEGLRDGAVRSRPPRWGHHPHRITNTLIQDVHTLTMTIMSLL